MRTKKLPKKTRPSLPASRRNGRKGGQITSMRVQFARSAEAAGYDISKPFPKNWSAAGVVATQ